MLRYVVFSLMKIVFSSMKIPPFTLTVDPVTEPVYMRVQEIYRACLYTRVQAICSFLCLRILFTLKGYLFRYNFWLYTFIVLFIIILIEKYHGKNMAEIY